jgi:hypothetical protein
VGSRSTRLEFLLALSGFGSRGLVGYIGERFGFSSSSRGGLSCFTIVFLETAVSHKWIRSWGSKATNSATTTAETTSTSTSASSTTAGATLPALSTATLTSTGLILLCGVSSKLNRDLAIENLLARQLRDGTISFGGGGEVNEGIANGTVGARVDRNGGALTKATYVSFEFW